MIYWNLLLSTIIYLLFINVKDCNCSGIDDYLVTLQGQLNAFLKNLEETENSSPNGMALPDDNKSCFTCITQTFKTHHRAIENLLKHRAEVRKYKELNEDIEIPEEFLENKKFGNFESHVKLIEFIILNVNLLGKKCLNGTPMGQSEFKCKIVYLGGDDQLHTLFSNNDDLTMAPTDEYILKCIARYVN